MASALLQGPDLLAQLLFTPLLAGWSIWVGIGISIRAGDFRVAQQLGLALGLAAVLLLGDGLGWRIMSAAFDRERLPTSAR